MAPAATPAWRNDINSIACTVVIDNVLVYAN
jgi:hypothetical protein